jgi:hypothetical protein
MRASVLAVFAIAKELAIKRKNTMDAHKSLFAEYMNADCHQSTGSAAGATALPVAPQPPAASDAFELGALNEKQRRLYMALKKAGTVRAILVSPACSAKSTLGNWIASVLSGEMQRAFMAGPSNGCDQFTLGPQARAMLEEFAYDTALDGCGKEFTVIDDRGYVDELGLRTVLSGRLLSGEVLDPRSPQYAKILNRPYNAGGMPHVAIVPVRATALVDPTTPANAAYLAKISEIIGVCKHFVPTDGDSRPAFQIQVVPVITCLDEVVWFEGHDASCLVPGYWAGRASEDNAMAKLEAAATTAGIDVCAAVYTGWLLSEPAGGYGDLSDPRVAVVWELLARAARFGTGTISQARAAGWLQ